MRILRNVIPLPVTADKLRMGQTIFVRQTDGLKNIGWHIVRKTRRKKKLLWKNLETKWTETLSVNDYRENQITLNSVIAQALNRGSLKEQYLVFRKDPSGAPVKNKKNVFLIYTV